ncbi:MAG: sigma-70 family RNA polymerase sigma factor [Chloroflexi bacterium]|nr:sigma-70 family RNA polymerase sigma factor [Chloroflexota bacterium]
MDINEKALLYRAQTGDRRAGETLFERYYLDIYTYLYYRVSDKSTAEEFSTKVFVQMIRRLPQFPNKKISFLSWLYNIARDLVDGKQGAFQPELFPVDMLGSDQDSENKSANRCFELAISHLNDQEKSMIIHRFVEGRSVKDLVKITNKSERAIQTLQRQALNSLQTALEREKCL